MMNKKGSSDLFTPVWEVLASVKLSVVVLLSLAATSIIGTVIPQNESPAAYVGAYGEFLYRIFYILDIFDMYHSWWFRFLLVMLTANIVVCSMERLSATWKIVFIKTPIFRISQFKKLSNKEEFFIHHSPEKLKTVYEPYIAKMFRYSRIETADGSHRIFAERGRWTRLGVYGVHLSVLLLLIGGLLGSYFGFEGFVNIPEGETVDSIRVRNTNQIYPLNFKIRCDDFDVQFYETGAPKEYRSSLTILEGGKPVLKKDIVVNDPLRYKGINIFQSSYGALSAKEVTLNFRSSETGMVYSKSAAIGRSIRIPEDSGEFLIKDYRNTFNFRGRNIGEVFIGTLTPSNGSPVQVILPLRFPDFDNMRKGKWMVSATDPQYVYYTGLQVTKDPSVWVVYIGFILMIIGCYITFFMSHQRICIEITRKAHHSNVTVSGSANKNKFGMDKKVNTISEKLAEMGRRG